MSIRRPNDVAALQRLLSEVARVPRRARPMRIEAKSAQDFVTDMDIALEERLRKALQRLHPGIAVFGEESVREGAELPDSAFIVDPLDGTGNWIAGLRICGVSVALVENGKTALAAVADIYADRVYGAVAGGGAWLGTERLVQPADPAPLMALSTGLIEQTHRFPEVFSALRKLGKVRNLGSQALQLCYVAEGALGICASMEARLWDDAAGRLVVTEAGGRYTSGLPNEKARVASMPQYSLAAHPAYHAQAREILGRIVGMPGSV